GPPAEPSRRIGAQSLESLARGDDAVVITVGDIALRRSDVFRLLDLATPARSAEVMRQMVMTTAAQLDALREGIDVPLDALDREIELAVAQQKASFALEVDENMPLEDYLRLRHGLTPDQYRDEVRRMVLASLLLERAVRLDQHRSATDSVALIVVEAEELAREIAAQLQAGASFAVLARKNSRHASAGNGGELPPIPIDAQIPLLEGRETMQPGELLGPAPITIDGKPAWRILRLDARHLADDRPWSELREDIETELAARPMTGEELAVFEARAVDRYRVSTPLVKP
ncbi:MAG TPA: peptidylprolyl isomerase, partial [Planctomycetota bacterium]|nr:peptidylprolyl isomerase [Planctomycetota bacterium]